MADSALASAGTLTPALRAELQEEIQQLHLPDAFLDDIESCLLPCAKILADRPRRGECAPVWGISGAQGAGKSTLVHFLAFLLARLYQWRVVTLSIDDFYLTRAERQELAHRVHPLLATRGVPGTHDVELGRRVILSLQHAEPQTHTLLPRFDKALDDRLPESHWPVFVGRPDLILFEGWCVATQPQPDQALALPINALERDEDPQGQWRDYVNQQLRVVYPQWFSLIDALIFLRVPSFEEVKAWRWLQEQKLRASLVAAGKSIPATLMDLPQIERFIQHYERLTRWNLENLPQRASLVLELQKNHRVSALRIPGEAAVSPSE